MTRAWTAALAATVAIAGCGGEDGAASGDGPAQLAPATGAVIYAEATVRPEGDRAEGVKAALRKVARRDDVLDLLVREIDETLLEEAGIAYAADVEPWLGERAGIFFLGLEDEPDGAVVLEARDEEAARAAIEKAAKRFEEDTAGELIDGHVVIGSPAGVAAARKAAEGESLGDSAAYADSIAPLSEERLGHVWLDVRAIFDALAGFEGVETYRDALRDAESPYAAVGLEVSEDRIALEASAPRPLAEALGALGDGRDTAASELVADLPADAWLAFGAAGIGKAFGDALGSTVAEGGPPGFDPIGEIERRTGVNLQLDLFENIDDIAVYGSGTGLTSLGAGLVIKSGDPEAVTRSLRALITSFLGNDVAVEDSGEGFVVRLRAAPFSFQVKPSGDRVAAALGADAADRLLDPQERLGDTEAFEQATEDLGDGARLSGLVQFGPLVGLIGSLAADDPDWAQVRPYLEAFDRLALGDRSDGDHIVTVIVARLR